MTSPDPPRRRLFSFSLKTLFVVVAVLGISIGWLRAESKWIRERDDAAEWVRGVNGRCNSICGDMVHALPGSAPAPWSIRILGAPGFDDIGISRRWVKDVDNLKERLPQLEKLFPEAKVHLF